MMNGKEELLQFLEYLVNIDNEINEELQPYYGRVLGREKACMNSYGLANPKEKTLLSRSLSIYKLSAKVKGCSSFEELEAMLRREIAEAKDDTDLFDLRRQLAFLSDYSSFKKKMAMSLDGSLSENSESCEVKIK